MYMHLFGGSHIVANGRLAKCGAVNDLSRDLGKDFDIREFQELFLPAVAPRGPGSDARL